MWVDAEKMAMLELLERCSWTVQAAVYRAQAAAQSADMSFDVCLICLAVFVIVFFYSSKSSSFPPPPNVSLMNLSISRSAFAGSDSSFPPCV